MRITAWRSVLLDSVLLLGLYAVLLVEALLPIHLVELIPAVLLCTAVILLGRRFPLAALALGAAATGALLFDYGQRLPLWPLLLSVVAAFAAGRRLAEVRPALVVFAAVLAAGLPVSWLVRDDGSAQWPSMAMALLFTGLLPWQLGRHLRLRAELARSGWDRAAQLEDQQRIVAEQARLRERARIASDMHDSLGHELSLIALRAGGLEVAKDLAEPHRGAARELRDSAAVATERLREIIGVLREETDAAPTEPVDDTVQALVRRAADSGMTVRLQVEESSVQPPLMVRRAAYRIVQEALTNVTKHASGAAVTVRLCTESGQDGATHTVVRVHNEAPERPQDSTVAGGRRGLAGLRERVRLIGGTLRAGEHAGGFEVLATLPHAAAPGRHSSATRAERTESARQLHTAQRRVRNSLISVFAVPATLFFVFLAVSGIVYVIDWYSSTWHDERSFAELRIGASHAQVAQVAPWRERERDSRTADPPRPSGARCEYYSATRNLFDYHDNFYRLCFRNGQLVAKNELRDPRENNG